MRIRFCAALFSGVGMEQVRGRYGACRVQCDVVFTYRYSNLITPTTILRLLMSDFGNINGG